MAFQFQHTVTSNFNNRITPAAIIEQFSNPLDCLTAHLMLECSEVLAGVKPANLVSLVNRLRPCGRNLYQLWQDHHTQIARRLGGLQFLVLQTKERALLLFCYNRQQLSSHLSHAGIRALLQKAGYDSRAETGTLLSELHKRITEQDSFPHEIGLFIGYPAKDVAAFMGLVKLPFTCQGPWKIFGNPGQSLALAEQFRHQRNCMCSLLSGQHTLTPCLDNLNTASQLFLRQPIDNSSHYYKSEAL